jgi:hypothetical protein
MAFLGKDIELRFGKGLVELRKELFSPEQMVLLTSNLEKNTSKTKPSRTRMRQP